MRSTLRFGTLLLLIIIMGGMPVARLWAEPPAAATQEQLPPPLKEYYGRTIAPVMGYQGAPWLIRKTREEQEHCAELLDALNVKPGQTVCDIGCGNGFYSLRLAKLVGDEGRVLAVDIQPEMLHLLSVRAEEAGATSIEPVQGTVIDPKLPDGEVDLILAVDVYHEFSHPEHMLRAMRKALKPTGRLVLVEFREEDPLVPIKPLHKMSKKQVLKELLPNGYKLVEEYDKLPWQHVMFFGPDPEAEVAEADASR